MLLDSKQVKEILNISNSMAYKVIRDLNNELDKQGYLTIRGRVPEDYLKERYKLSNKDLIEPLNVDN